MKEPPEFITSAQLAERLQLSPATVSQYAKAGRIVGAQKWGNRWRFDPASVRLLAARPESAEVARSEPLCAQQSPGAGDASHFPASMPLKQRLAEIRRHYRPTR